MQQILSRGIGISLLIFGIIGLFYEGIVLNMFNVDFASDVIRILAGLFLFTVSFDSSEIPLLPQALVTVGILSVILGTISLVDPSLGALMTSSLTKFDMLGYLLVGLVAILAGARRTREHYFIEAS